MAARLLIAAASLLAAACNGFDGFPRASQQASGTVRVQGTGDLLLPRFAAGGGGGFLVHEGRDAGGRRGVFLTDLALRTPELVSVPDAGGLGSDDSFGGTASALGDLVAFRSRATNLAGGAPTTFERAHAYLRDRLTGETILVSQSEDGEEANDETTGVAINGGGRFVVFATRATNLVADDTKGVSQIYLLDLASGLLDLVTREPGTAEGANLDSFDPAISTDGRVVAFRRTRLSAGGGAADVFVYDRSRRVLEQLSADPLFDAGPPQVSADGNGVVFSARSTATAARQVYAVDVAAGTTALVSATGGGSAGNAESRAPAVSPDGRFVAFETDASNLGAADAGAVSDVYVHDRATGDVALVSIGLAGTEANGDSRTPSLSPDGRSIAFSTYATDLVELRPEEEETAAADILIVPNPLG